MTMYTEKHIDNYADKIAPLVCVTSLRSAPDLEIIRLLQKNGFEPAPLKEAQLWIVVVDAIGDPRLGAINQRAFDRGMPLFILKPAAREIEYALFTNSTACWACFEKRNSLLDGPATYLYHALRPDRPVTEPAMPSDTILSLVSRWAIFELKRYMAATDTNALAGTLRTVLLDRMDTTTHPVARLPHCTVCGKPPHPTFPEPLVLDRDIAMVS